MQTIDNHYRSGKNHNLGRRIFPIGTCLRRLFAFLIITSWTASYCTSAYPMESIVPKIYHNADAPPPASSDLRYTIIQENEREILSFSHQEDVSVLCGFPSLVGFPNSIEVNLDDYTSEVIGVKWDSTHGLNTPGIYRIYGSFILSKNIINPRGLKPYFNLIVEDKTPPQIIFDPRDYQVDCDRVVTFDLPEAVDECDAVTITQVDGTGLGPGKVFPYGTTTLTYRISDGSGNYQDWTIDIEVFPPAKLQHRMGIGLGDTLHMVACTPPGISPDDLIIPEYWQDQKLKTRIFKEDLPTNSHAQIWNLSNYYYEASDDCWRTEAFHNYVAMYDLSPPMIRNVPADISIPSLADVPNVPTNVTTLDLCRFVVWDTVLTLPILHPVSQDTVALVRRWIAEDEVGNRSWADQIIHLPRSPRQFGMARIRIGTENDLLKAHFPETAGTPGVGVALYRVDNQDTSTLTLVDYTETSNWDGQMGTAFFSPLVSGKYRIKIDLPDGYTSRHAQLRVDSTGWSEIMQVTGNRTLNLGTVVLVKESDEIHVLAEDKTPHTRIDTPAHTGGKLTVFPNPTSSRLKLKLPTPEIHQYQIYDYLGKIVKHGNVSSYDDLDLTGHPNGIYIIKVTHADGWTGTTRIVLTP